MYERPRTAFVATFFGESNLFAGPRGRTVAVRPERLQLRPGAGGAPERAGVVAEVSYLGERLRIGVVLADGARAVVSVPNTGSGASVPAPGAPVTLSWRPEDAVELEAE
jgi:ABC-type Fe3+/spermidine/putrescine transport system ATPase subunit